VLRNACGEARGSGPRGCDLAAETRLEGGELWHGRVARARDCAGQQELGRAYRKAARFWPSRLMADGNRSRAAGFDLRIRCFGAAEKGMQVLM